MEQSNAQIYAEEVESGTVTDEQRRLLGSRGKLWHVEAHCDLVIAGQRNDTAKWERSNMTKRELDALRQFIFSAGLMLPMTMSATAFIIIPPRDIRTIYADLQSRFFD
jgi:hypothetical protein